MLQIKPATKHTNFSLHFVIPEQAGIQYYQQTFLDSGSPLRCGRNDIFNCRVNNLNPCLR